MLVLIAVCKNELPRQNKVVTKICEADAMPFLRHDFHVQYQRRFNIMPATHTNWYQSKVGSLSYQLEWIRKACQIRILQLFEWSLHSVHIIQNC